jgi:hypothetical protein
MGWEGDAVFSKVHKRAGLAWRSQGLEPCMHCEGAGPGPVPVLVIPQFENLSFSSIFCFTSLDSWIIPALKFGYFKFHDLIFWCPTSFPSSSLGKLYLFLSSALWQCWWALGLIIHSTVSDGYPFCQQIPHPGSLLFPLVATGFLR